MTGAATTREGKSSPGRWGEEVEVVGEEVEDDDEGEGRREGEG